MATAEVVFFGGTFVSFLHIFRSFIDDVSLIQIVFPMFISDFKSYLICRLKSRFVALPVAKTIGFECNEFP